MAKTEILYKTPLVPGYHRIITKDNASLQYLSYHRLILAQNASYSLKSGDQEIGCMCVNGGAKIVAKGHKYEIGAKDGMYIPCSAQCEIENCADRPVDLVLALAPCTVQTEFAFVSRQEIESSNERHKIVGAQPYRREVFLVIGPETKAERLILGYTISAPGQWTSWPPHEHMETQEEIYVYFDSGKNDFSIQLVCSGLRDSDFCQQVFDGDAVAVSGGYHPTVSAPNCTSKYIWMIAAKEPKYRRTDIAKVHPDYA